MQKPQRHHLPLSENQLRILRTAVDTALGVDGAKRMEQKKGRQAAIAALKGEAVPSASRITSRHNIVRKRSIDIRPVPFVKKRPSGRSNWPRTAEERARVKARCAERKALGLHRWMTDKTGLGQTSTPNHEAYLPSGTERDALLLLASDLSTQIGRAVLNPTAWIGMVADGSPAWSKGRRGGRRVEVALHSDTPPLLFRNPGGGPRASSSEGESLMAAGEMLVFDRGLMHCHTGGDYRRTVTFEVRS